MRLKIRKRRLNRWLSIVKEPRSRSTAPSSSHHAAWAKTSAFGREPFPPGAGDSTSARSAPADTTGPDADVAAVTGVVTAGFAAGAGAGEDAAVGETTGAGAGVGTGAGAGVGVTFASWLRVLRARALDMMSEMAWLSSGTTAAYAGSFWALVSMYQNVDTRW